MSYPSSDPGNQPPGFGPPPSGQYQSGGQYGGGQYPPQGSQPTQYAGQQGGYGYPQQPPGAYPPGGYVPGGQVPPGGKPRRKGMVILFSVLGGVLVLGAVLVVRLVLPNLLGGGVSPEVGECLNEPPDFQIVECGSAEAVYQTVTVEGSPSGTDAVAVAADLGCGFREVLWEEREGSGDLLWVACADRLGGDAAPTVGDCLDGGGTVVACDDSAAVEEVTFTATEDLPRDADQATNDALVELCPGPDDTLYTSWEGDGEAVLWMVCTTPVSGGGGGVTAVADLQAGDCLDDDPEFFVVVDCDDPAAVEEVAAVHVDLTDTVESTDDLQTLAGQLCDTSFYWAGWDQTPGTPVNWLVCVEQL